MDYYYAMTNYQLLGCICHKIVFNKNNKAVLQLSSFLTNNNPDIMNNVKKTGIFDEVFVFEEVIFSHDDGVDINEEIGRISGLVDEKYGGLIKGCDNKYIGQDVDALGVYLVKNGIKYNFMEDACGSYSNQELLMSIIKSENINRYNVVARLGLGGKSKCVMGCFCDFDSQRKGFDKNGCTDFSIKKILKEMSKKDIDKVLSVYNCKKYSLGNKRKVLLLTWHYNNMGFMSLDEQRTFFTFLVDYFKDESEALFIKPHPSDKQPDYRRWFKDAVVIEKHTPSELLPFLVDGKFEKGITNWSTSIYGLRDLLKTIVNFDKGIDGAYCDFNKMFAIVKYLDSIKITKKVQKIGLVNVDKSQLHQLMLQYVKEYEKYYQISDDGADFCIIDKYDDGYYGQKCIALDRGDNYAFSGFLKVGFGKDRQDVFLYNMPCSDLHLKKKLEYSGCYVCVDSYSLSGYVDLLEEKMILNDKRMKRLIRENDNRISELNGRIHNYEERVDALRKEIDGMLSSSSWRMTEPLRKINEIRRKHGIRRNEKSN